MKFTWDMKSTMLAVAWIVATAATGFGTGTESYMGWLMVTVLALGPATVLLHFSAATPQTISQGIHEARR